MRVVAVGGGFYPYAHPGDKTFWLQLFQALAAGGDEIHVVNVARRARPRESAGPGISIETIPAIPVHFQEGTHVGRYNEQSSDIPSTANYASRSLTLPRLVRRARAAVRETRADVVHFMDNMGPADYLFARAFGVPSYVTAVTYDPRGVLYDPLLRASLAPFDGVVATSDTFARRLGEIGLERRRIHAITWGADPTAHAPTSDPARAKETLGLDPARPLVLWAGYLQQTTEKDLRLAHEAVRFAQARVPGLAAWFCFKPQHFRPSYLDLEAPGIRCGGDPTAFALARAAADVFLSPITRPNSILAPPLTWTEMMLRGIPILTTPCGGADESLGAGRGGDVSPPLALGERLAAIVGDAGELSRRKEDARRWGVERYSLPNLASNYRELWSGSAT